MTIGVYVRVSTAGQKKDSQKAEIRKWLKAHDHDLKNVTWFEDKDSGSKINRENLNALNKAIFDGDIKTVIVWKLDRIARTQKNGINTLCNWCDAGVRVVSVTQQIDLSGTMGRIVAGVLFGIAKIELSNIKERQAAGIAVAKENGVYKGRKTGTLKAKPKRAKALRNQGLKNSEIMKILGIKSRTTLNKYLTN
ncbi:MAG: recombinase family protein [Pseudomonadota bacterium]